MLGTYYRIWVDMITRINLQDDDKKKNWRTTCMIAMTYAMVSNLVLIMILLQKYVFGFHFYHLNLSFLPKKINTVFSFFILFILPVLIFNYLLIFRRNHYEKLLEKYPYKYNGKLFLYYFLISVGLPIVLLVVGMIIVRL